MQVNGGTSFITSPPSFNFYTPKLSKSGLLTFQGHLRDSSLNIQRLFSEPLTFYHQLVLTMTSPFLNHSSDFVSENLCISPCYDPFSPFPAPLPSPNSLTSLLSLFNPLAISAVPMAPINTSSYQIPTSLSLVFITLSSSSSSSECPISTLDSKMPKAELITFLLKPAHFDPFPPPPFPSITILPVV